VPGLVSTFDGRDVFAPTAARLAAGAEPGELGARADPATLTPLWLPSGRVYDGAIRAEVVHVDGFGNVQLSAPARLLDEAGIAAGGQVLLRVGAVTRPATVCGAFADVPVGRMGILRDAFNRLQVAVNRGSAAQLLGARVGAPVVVRPLDAA
jgi:S-adenosyl-L-methionine hydrolase (adenosine-forming)